MTDVTLCMLVSNNRPRIVWSALTSALRYVMPQRVVLGVSKRWKNSTGQLKKWIGKQAKCDFCDGANSRLDIALARRRMYDWVSTEWIVNVDDDDGIMGRMPLELVPPEVACVHSDVLAVCSVATGNHLPGDVFLRHGQRVLEPKGCCNFIGSYYAYRTTAWKQVSGLVTRTEFEEWIVLWHMLKRGWHDCHVPMVMQWQRLRDYISQVAEYRKRGVEWTTAERELEKQWMTHTTNVGGKPGMTPASENVSKHSGGIARTRSLNENSGTSS